MGHFYKYYARWKNFIVRNAMYKTNVYLSQNLHGSIMTILIYPCMIWHNKDMQIRYFNSFISIMKLYIYLYTNFNPNKKLAVSSMLSWWEYFVNLCNYIR